MRVMTVINRVDKQQLSYIGYIIFLLVHKNEASGKRSSLNNMTTIMSDIF